MHVCAYGAYFSAGDGLGLDLCVGGCAGVLRFIGESLHAVAESATVLQQQRLSFLTEIRCRGLAEEDRGDEGQEMERNEREAVSVQIKYCSDYLQVLVRLCTTEILVRQAQQMYFMVAQPSLDV